METNFFNFEMDTRVAQRIRALVPCSALQEGCLSVESTSGKDDANRTVLKRNKPSTALELVGGTVPLQTTEFARRAYAAVLNPGYNPVKEVMDMFPNVRDMPPMLGIFNDIPSHLLREDEVHSWAKAGFSWIINDGEHQVWEGRYGREQNMMELRLGLLPVQRLHREAVSEHGDQFVKGARATMRPYATTVAEAQAYYRAVQFPVEGKATPEDRGGFPVRGGDRKMKFTPEELRAAEVDTQGWLQFETGEYILDKKNRDAVLSVMQQQGRNRACGFIGPFDAVMRDGSNPKLNDAVNDLIREAADRNIAMGRVCGSGALENPRDIEEAMFTAIKHGCRFISVHYMTSDLPFLGASNVAQPFFNACQRAGF